MSPADLERTARAYEELLTPVLFGPWSVEMVRLAEVGPEQSVLDVACGTGVLARAVAAGIGPEGAVRGLDANPGMLAVASTHSSSVEWREGTAESLPFEDGAFDVVVSQFGLMLFASREAAIREMWRVLRARGRLHVAVFGSLEAMPAYGAMAQVYAQVVDPAIGDVLRVPFSLGDPDGLTSLFRRAGVTDPEVSRHHIEARFQDVRHMVLADVRGWFPFAQIQLEDDAIERVITRAREALAPFTADDGTVRFDVTVQLVQATKS